MLTLESRRSPELALLVMNYGGTPVVAPSLREVPLESNHQALTFAEDLIQQRFGMVVLMTGVGVRLLVKIVEPVCGRDTFVRALAQTRIVARGPKPVAALREIGLAPWVTVPSPNTWRELLATLDARADDAPLARRAGGSAGVRAVESRPGAGAGSPRRRRGHGADLSVVDARGCRTASERGARARSTTRSTS